MSGWFSSFFFDPSQSGALVRGAYAPELILLSVFVSIVALTTALYDTTLARNNRHRAFRRTMLRISTISLGVSIWAVHAIGMLSIELPVGFSYDAWIILLAVLPAWLAARLMLRVLIQRQVSTRRMIVYGALVGLYIAATHYASMAAIKSTLLVRYDTALFFWSLIAFVGLSIFVLWVRYRLQRTNLNRFQRLLAAGALMGLALAAMQYAGMVSVRFVFSPNATRHSLPVDASYFAIGVSFIVLIASVMGGAFNALIRAHTLYRAVDEGRSRLRAMLDTAVDGIITIDSRGLIQDVNQSVQRLFGWRAEELIGRNVKMLMPDPDQSGHDGYLRNYLKTGKAKIIGSGREVTGLRKDGSLLPMRLAVGRVDLPGELLFVGFVTDISDRRALEDSLREAVEHAEQAATAKSLFLANMSHELRTPMNAIIGFTDLLLQTELNTQQRDHLTVVSRSSRSLLRLLNDILDTTKIEKGHMELNRTDFSLKQLAAQLKSSLWLSAQSKNLSLTTIYPDDMPEYFQGDPMRVLQILSNLVGNAIKFTEQGGVEIIFSHEQGQVHIQVCDTGIGMTPQQLTDIFAPFAQADPSISSRFGGTGLGTTIARQLAELMNGRIHAESVFGEGSTFHVWLTLPPGQPIGEGDVLSCKNARQLPPLRILIADDVPQNLELLSATLQGAGHQVVMAKDGAEAVDKLINEGEFNVVLMDVHMPNVDGLQATRSIRQYERESGCARTPIIALTASVMANDRRAARQAGMDGFSVKPLDIRHLFDEIAQALKLNTINRQVAQQRSDPAAVRRDMASFLPAMQALLHTLKRSEWDEDILTDVCRGLTQAGLSEQASALRAATDAFEFDQACVLLQHLLDEQQAKSDDGNHAALD